MPNKMSSTELRVFHDDMIDALKQIGCTQAESETLWDTQKDTILSMHDEGVNPVDIAEFVNNGCTRDDIKNDRKEAKKEFDNSDGLGNMRETFLGKEVQISLSDDSCATAVVTDVNPAGVIISVTKVAKGIYSGELDTPRVMFIPWSKATLEII